MMRLFSVCSLMLFSWLVMAEDLPKLLTDKAVANKVYLPDFSYAGYRFGEQQPDLNKAKIIKVEDHGLIADDKLDDTQAFLKLLKTLNNTKGNVVIQFGAGRYILSDIISIQRSHLTIRGQGSGLGGTEFYFPRPLNYVKTPESLYEIRDYLVKLNKIQREPLNNIHLPFTIWSWTGGFFWVEVPGQQVKSYLDEYEQPEVVLANGQTGEKGGFTVTVDSVKRLKVGDVVQLNWYNKGGEKGSFIDELYHSDKVVIGSHHWNYPKLALSRQQVKITAIKDNQVTIKSPLLHAVKTEWGVTLSEWKHLEEVGLESFRMTFPLAPEVAHHVEEGFNAIYLTRLFNGWVSDVKIENSDSGILTENIANVSITDVETRGEKLAHYSVQIGGVHNVLVENLLVKNAVRHPLSFNTFATKNVYLNCRVELQPALDQHSGANHQNLFDNTQVVVTLPSTGDKTHALFEGGGAPYWKPSHASYPTFWNTRIHFMNRVNTDGAVVLNGMTQGPNARIVGISGNQPVKVDYRPDPYVEGENHYYSDAPSLYQYQLKQRLSKK